MDERTADTTRRRLLKGAATTGLLYGGVGAAAADELDDAVGTAADATGEATEATAYPPKVREVLAPLALNPTIETGGETLRVELDASVDAADPTVTVRPTFGSVRPETDLRTVAVEAGEASDLWIDGRPGEEGYDEDGRRPVTVVEAELPPVGETVGVGAAPTVAPGLYDVAVSWDGGEDVQPRSLHLRESYPDEPRVYVVSDAHAGDPRAMADALERSADEGSAEPFLFRYEQVFGVGTGTERWGAFRRSVAEVSALDPDLVVFPGDLAFGQDAPKKFYQEYEDAYAMLSTLRAPVYTALGNHDGYVQGTTDGKRLYRNYVGPWYYSRELWDGFRLTCLDTYDWSELDRAGVSYGVSAWGGQVRETQRERLRELLEAWYDPDADQTHVSVSHHSPAWRRDPDNEVKSTGEGTPGAEQVTRGSSDFATGGQSWSGEGRTETLALLSAFDAVVHFAGHEHRDRLSRVDGGEVVYTPTGEAGLVRYDHGTGEVLDDDADPAALTGGGGTLFVDATTASSETGQYWGWRYYDVEAGAATLDPSAFGYPADEAFLEEAALEPESWPAAHAEYGRYAHPSFRFDAERLETDGDAVAVEVRNGLATAQTGTLLLSVPDAPGVDVDGGEVVWRRRGDDRQDVTVAYDVDAESERVVRVRPTGR